MQLVAIERDNHLNRVGLSGKWFYTCEGCGEGFTKIEDGDYTKADGETEYAFYNKLWDRYLCGKCQTKEEA